MIMLTYTYVLRTMTTLCLTPTKNKESAPVT